MKKIFTVIYSTISLVIVFALLLYSGLRLFNMYRKNILECEKNLAQMKQVLGQGGEVHRELKTMDRLLILTIYSPEKGLLFTASKPTPKSSSFLKSPFKNKPDYKDKELPVAGLETLTKNFSEDPGVELYIEGVFTVLTYKEISKVLVIGFIFFSSWLGLTILLRIFFITDGDNVENRYGKMSHDRGLKDYLDGDKDMAENPDKWESEDPDPTLTWDVEAKETMEESLAIDEEVEIDLSPGIKKTVEDFSPMEREAIPESTGGAENTEEPGNTTNNRPIDNDTAGFTTIKKNIKSNLFSPKTGLGWEEHLVTRLETELKRTASFDQDMAFACISIDKHEGLRNFEHIIRSVAKVILELFLFQDLSFEYGTHGFAVILPDANIKRAIGEMEIFQRKVTGIAFEGQYLGISIGISARNGRLVGGEKLLMETRRALEKAIEDGRNRIVAFNPDPEKYREMVSRKMSKT